jgi:hypothetical protein
MPVDLAAVQTAVDDLNAAVAAQAQGGPAATVEGGGRFRRLLPHGIVVTSKLSSISGGKLLSNSDASPFPCLPSYASTMHIETHAHYA